MNTYLLTVGVGLTSLAWLFLLGHDAAPSSVSFAWMWLPGALALGWGLRSNAGGRALFAKLGLLLWSQAALFLLLDPIALQLAARTSTVPVLPHVLAWMLDLLGLRAAASDGFLHLMTAAYHVPIRIGWEAFGVLTMCWLLVNHFVAARILNLPDKFRHVLRAGVWLLAYALLRFTVLALLIVLHDDPLAVGNHSHDLAIRYLQEPWTQVLSWLPVVLLGMHRLLLSADFGEQGIESSSARVSGRNPTRRATRPATMACAAALILCTVAALSAAMNWPTTGQARGGRVLIDDAHSVGWSPSDTELNRSEYGRETVYNFATFTDWLSRHFEVAVHTDGRFSEEQLANTDVLVIKTPTIPFTEQDVALVERFVQHGGGLFLIGDHTNLLGMGWNLNQLGEPFGLEFRFDAVNNVEDGRLHTAAPNWAWPHPITRRVEQLDFMTSCSLDVSPAWSAPLIGEALFADPLDYSQNSFFGHVVPDVGDAFGPLVLMAAREYGAGRVVAFSDSTIFSTFSVLRGDTPDLLIDTVDYLNHINDPADSGAALCLLLAGLSAVGLGLMYRRGLVDGSQLAQLGPTAALAGLALASVAVDSLMDTRITDRQPYEEITTVAFVEGVGGALFPSPMIESDSVPDAASFDVFFTWVQRLGWFPRTCTLEEALQHDAVVVINPDTSLPAHAPALLESYVAGGGKLLVLDRWRDPQSSAGRLLAPFGLGVGERSRREDNHVRETALRSMQEQGSTNALGAADTANPADTPALDFDGVYAEPLSRRVPVPAPALFGGTSVFEGEGERVLVTTTQHGAGRVIAVADSALFSRVHMGSQMDTPEPGDDCLAVFELEYRLFEDYLLPEFQSWE